MLDPVLSGASSFPSLPFPPLPLLGLLLLSWSWVPGSSPPPGSLSWEGSLSLRRAGCSKGGGQPLWGRPRETGSLWLTNGVFSPPDQASEVTGEDQDNLEVFYTVERDESGELVCLCSDTGEAYDKIGGSPLEGTGGEARPSRCGALTCVTAREPGGHKGLWEEQVPILHCAGQSGQQPHQTQEPSCPKGPPGMPS